MKFVCGDKGKGPCEEERNLIVTIPWWMGAVGIPPFLSYCSGLG